jgi:hypothetical protein
MEKAHRNLVQWGIDQGYTIEVACEGETEYVGTIFADAIDAIEACDNGVISFTKPSEYIAWFSYIFDWDQAHDEIVSDWGINPVSNAWYKHYTGESLLPVVEDDIDDDDDPDLGHYSCQNFPNCDLYGCGG